MLLGALSCVPGFTDWNRRVVSSSPSLRPPSGSSALRPSQSMEVTRRYERPSYSGAVVSCFIGLLFLIDTVMRLFDRTLSRPFILQNGAYHRPARLTIFSSPSSIRLLVIRRHHCRFASGKRSVSALLLRDVPTFEFLQGEIPVHRGSGMLQILTR